MSKTKLSWYVDSKTVFQMLQNKLFIFMILGGVLKFENADVVFREGVLNC